MWDWDVYLGDEFLGVWRGNVIGLDYIDLNGKKYKIQTTYWTPSKMLSVVAS